MKRQKGFMLGTTVEIMQIHMQNEYFPPLKQAMTYSFSFSNKQCLQLPGFVRVFPEILFGKRTTHRNPIFTEIDSP